jgi:cytochrome c oxidase assembly protein subunit 15
MTRLARFSWIVLAYNIAVIAWGAYVRATGSGAGCGHHWPLCNGEILPRSPGATTLIEFSHRLTSGLALLLVVALFIWTRRTRPPGHPARVTSALSVVFILTEAAVGAGLVLFQLVADNASMARALFMLVHLMNTFVLLGCLTLSAWWLSDGSRISLEGRRSAAVGVAAGCVGLLIASGSGAVAALGDTLFPSASLADAMRADLSSTSHLLIRLRVLHPVLAIGTALGLIAGAPRLAKNRGRLAARLSGLVAALAAVQIFLGFVNVLLLAPVWMQLIHLIVADAIWVSFVLLGAQSLANQERSRSKLSPAA